MLTAPPPTLLYDDQPSMFAALEKPVGVLVEHALDDSAEVGPEVLSTAAFFVYRRSSPGAVLDIWDDGAKQWSSENVSRPRTGVALAYQPQQVPAWKGIIVGAGGKDADGQSKFVNAAGGYPEYSVRAYFVSRESGEAYLTGASDPFAFASVTDKYLLTIGPGEDEKPEDATQARFLLKNTGLQAIGRVLIERDSPGARVTVDNASGASIVLHPDGHIELVPASGARVVVSGDIEAEHITYLPANSSTKATL